VLSAAPALAQQQSQAAADARTSAAVTTSAPQAAVPETPKPVPSLFVSTDEVRRQVRAAEEERAAGEAQVGSRSWIYLVAAVTSECGMERSINRHAQ
jgi:hypothetical protein